MMPTLENNAERFLAATRTAGIDAHFSPTSPADLQTAASSLPLSSDLLAWYHQAAPIDVELYLFTEYMWLSLYDPTQLLKRQRGYRFHGNHPEQRLEGWEESWLVIGDWNADPVIAHTDRPGTPISMALHGAGSWDLVPVAQDLAAYLAALAISIEFSMIEHPGIYDFDSDSEPGKRPEINRMLRERLSTVLEERCLPYWPWVDYP